MYLDNNSLIMQWNTDTNGNPVSRHIPREVQQVSPTHNLIQLTQIPDEFYPLRIITEDNIELSEVKHRNDIAEDSFSVDYGLGLVYFHESLKGKMIIINYYGRGVMLISDSRIFHRDGDTIADTWDNIIERSQDALDLIEHAGGLSNAIKVIDKKVEEGTQVADRLENFITETQFYGYTITLSREAFVVKADEDGDVGKTEISSVYTDVVVYKGAKQIVPTLTVSNEQGCSFKVEGQRVKLTSMNINFIKTNAVLNIDCGDGLVAQRVLEVTKVFDGVNQYQVSMTNPFYSFQANSEGFIEEDQTVTCCLKVTKANIEYENYQIQVQNAPQGLNYKINKDSVTFTGVEGRLLPSSGTCLVVATIDGRAYNNSFSWNKVRKGVDAKTLKLVGSQIIRYETPDFSDIPAQRQTTISAKISGLSGTPTWSFFDGAEWALLQNVTGTELTFEHNDQIIWSDRKEVTIKCELEGYSDEITVVKLANGVNGNDAITVILTNESHTVPIDDSGVVAKSEIDNSRTTVLAYKGAKSIVPRVSKGRCVGCDVKITQDIVQLISLDNSFTSSTAELIIEVDGVSTTKVWTISKSRQGLQGESGQNGSTLILNVTGGTRSVTYSQINHDPRPSISSTFVATLYVDGVEISDGLSWYWIASGHFTGTSILGTFTPTIRQNFDESVTSNNISVTVTYKGQTITQEVPLSVTKDANGLDWVQEWDDTKTDVRGNLILTPKIFAGSYDQENDLVTGVAVGQDVLNNDRTVGIVGYQNNIPSFLLDTDGSLQVGNPFQENSTGLYYSNGVFKLKVNELSIEGSKVATEDEIGGLITSEVNSAKNELEESINNLSNSLGSLEDVLNNGLQDGILTEVEKQALKIKVDTLKGESTTLTAQIGSVLVSPFLSNTTLLFKLEELSENYETTYNTLLDVYNRITEGNTPSDEDVALFNETLYTLREVSEELNQVLIDCLTDISQTQATQLVDKAKEEIKAEVDDVNNALTDLENTINGDFKVGLVTSINLANLENHLHQLAKEKADIDAQYKIIFNNKNLSNAIKQKLIQAKSDYDIIHDALVAKINSAITDNLMTEQELKEINTLIKTYATKLGTYSGVAQEANADIVLRTAQGVVDALDQEAIFNKLTNNGEVQGIYLQDGKVYINGEYINSRNLKAVRNDGTETFKIDSEGNVHIKANSFYLVGDDTNIADKDYVDNAIDSIVIDNVELTQEQVFNALTNNGQTQGVYLQNGKIYLNGEYLKAKSITADKLHADVLSANNIVSTINGGSTNISGNKIRTGVISSNNGKSTINLDSGAMNLGTISDSSYLQWTGSTLNIKANSINIGASSVATTTDVGNAKNEAINSANSNTANTLKGYYTKTQTDSAIKVAKDEINLGVSQTYETKTIVDSKINGINIGGTNLAYDTNKGATGWGWAIQTNGGRTIIEYLADGVKGVKMVKDGTAGSGWNYVSYGRFKRDKITPATTYVVSFEMKSNLTFNVGSVYLMNGDSSNNLIKSITAIQNKVTANSTSWNKIVFKLVTFDTLPSSTAQVIYITGIPDSANATHYFRNLKLEVGNTATAWSPALEDTTADITTAKNEAVSSANSTLTSTIANYYTKTQTDSQINIAKDEINLGVSQTYETKSNVESKINGIQVGGRNLLKNSNNIYFTGSDFPSNITRENGKTTVKGSGKFNSYCWVDGRFSTPITELVNPIGRTFTMSVDVKTTNLQQTDVAISLDFRVGSTLVINRAYLDKNKNGVWYRISASITVNRSDYTSCLFSLHNTGSSDNTGLIVEYRNWKLEIGTKATDYNEAPEDINLAIDKKANSTDVYKKSETYTKSETDSQIKVAKDAINLGVSQTYETKSNVTSQVTSTLNSAKSYADTKKSEAISSASSDATTKANNALNNAKSYADTKKQEAITSANNTLNSTIANYYTKTQTDSQINVAKNAITQSVASTYETKTESTTKYDTVTAIAKAMNEGKMLYTDTAFRTGSNSVNTYNNTGNGNVVIERITKPSDCPTTSTHCIRITHKGTASPNLGGFYQNIQSRANAIFIQKFVAKLPSGYTLNIASNSMGNGYTDKWLTSNKGTGKWETYIRQVVCGSTGTFSTGGHVHVSGATPTASAPLIWYLASCTAIDITDTDERISSLTTRISSAESKITDTAITNTVKKNFYTKTETENAITSKGYATSTQLQQTATNFTYKFSQSGGYNLVRNGNPKPWKEQHWWVSSNAWWYRNATDIGIQSSDSNESYVGSATIKVEPGKTYSFSCWIMVESNVKGTDVYFIGSSKDDGAYEDVQHLYTSGSTGWVQVKKTFSTGSNTNYGFIRIDHNGVKQSGAYTVVFFSEVLLVKGSECYPQWSPNPNEVYDGITTIDKDGIKVSTSKGAYTHFSADGMNSYNNSNVQTLGIRNGGLTIHNGGEYVGFISQSQMSNAGLNGISIANANQGEYIALGWDNNATDPNAGFNHTHVLTIYKDNYSGINGTKGVNMFDNLNMQDKNISNVWTHYVNGSLRMNNNATLLFDATAAYPSAIWEETSSGNLAVFGDNGVVLGYKNGATNTNIFKIAETNDNRGCKINSYEHWNFNSWTMYNMQLTFNGFSRTTADYVKMFKSSSSSESNFCVELANDYVTYFNIQANNYADGGKYIARFHYHNGTAANIVGVHFYRAINMHGFNISNVGNMNVFTLATEEVVANDIKIASPYAVMSRSGEVESLSVVKTTDDVTEHNDTVTVVNGRAEVYLPVGLVHMGYLVQATPNKLVKIAVTEKLDDYFVIEVDSDEEVEVDYCIKAFQPNYATRVATYGELQGEESPQATTAEEAGECDEVQYFNEIAPLDYVSGDSLTIE